MMKAVVRALAVAGTALMAGPVCAADWWLVSGDPRDQAAIFADVETLARQDGGASVRVLRIDRAGRADEALERVRCSGRVDSKGEEAVRRFACSSDQDRDQFGLILAGMRPDEVARMIFGGGSVDSLQDDVAPRGQI